MIGRTIEKHGEKKRKKTDTWKKEFPSRMNVSREKKATKSTKLYNMLIYQVSIAFIKFNLIANVIAIPYTVRTKSGLSG